MDYISLKDLCDMLSISPATGRNWIKLGKITPAYIQNRTPYFKTTYVKKYKAELLSGKNQALKSRRNKKFVSGNSFYNSYVSQVSMNLSSVQSLLALAKEASITFNNDIIQYLVTDCAIKLFAHKNNCAFKNETGLFEKYLKNEISFDIYDELLAELIKDCNKALYFCQKHPSLFSLNYYYEANEDILGLIYMSCKNISNRKAMGSYYTPTKIVHKLISKLNIQPTGKILDPCCGTGNFLLQLPTSIPFENIYGNDIDSICIKITRINMALKYDSISPAMIKEHITRKNYLLDYPQKNFQYIIGNPPWGYDFSNNDKVKLKKYYKTASTRNVESYDVFVESALNSLATDGQLSFVLPEAILNVKSHKKIREIILEANSIKYLEYLGNTFDGVQCPSIILQLVHTKKPLSTKGMELSLANTSSILSVERNLSADNFSLLTTDEEYLLLQKIRTYPSIKYLKNNADFALGIVTGNNEAFISNDKTSTNEPLVKGSDISKFKIKQATSFITFTPEAFQQVAPVEMYRAKEKLFYRFISNELVFAYDDQQKVSLNSCNILIPKLEGLNIKYVLAILNSSLAQFIFKKEFNSIKVLRSHVERIPIPVVTEELQNKIIELASQLILEMNPDTSSETYNRLDELIFDIFDLSEKERALIKKAGS